MESLERLLQVVRARLGAEDAHLEIGGIAPRHDEHCVVAQVDDGVRLVARFGERPPDEQDIEARLTELIKAFQGIGDTAKARAMSIVVEPERLGGAGLAGALAILADRAGASRIFVIDADSPVIWAAHPHDAPGLSAAGTTPIFELLRRVRDGDDLGDAAPEHHIARFGGIYRIVLLFDEGNASPLRVEGAVRRALPVVEKLVFAFPPIEPDPSDDPTKGASVVRLKRP